MSKSLIYNRVSFFKDLFILLLIIITPFLFFLYTIAPEDVTEWKTRFFHINLSKTGYDVNATLWYFSYKLLFFIVFILWFITCKHWWRYVLLVPLLVEVYKISGMCYELNGISADYKFYYSFISWVPLIIILFILSKKLNYYSLSKSINKQIDEEIYVLMNQVSNYKTVDYKEFKVKLISLRKQKENLDKKEYLVQLIKLRDDYTLGKQKE
ncbi:hypothetical protein [Lacinutrix himadriensis]|uniref:hypothetical protein n=1 Tax=Lacinutrix himadriensis TaxID=641549 RepID=UPI0006E2C983|nr:hypothetical protein [Lacinutrix himadriensis]